MTITSAPPSPKAIAMLKALQEAVSRTLEKKRRLGQYAVIWQNGRPVQSGDDVPKTVQGPRSQTQSSYPPDACRTGAPGTGRNNGV